MRGSVFRADSLEDRVSSLIWKRTGQIATQSLYPIASRDLVEKWFELNRPFPLPLDSNVGAIPPQAETRPVVPF